MSGFDKWAAFEDSDEEDVGGVVKERAEYEVVGAAIIVLRAPRPDESLQVGFKTRGDAIRCDARSGDGNWVRLCETFPSKGEELRGWAMIDGTSLEKEGVGVLLRRIGQTQQQQSAPAPAPAPALKISANDAATSFTPQAVAPQSLAPPPPSTSYSKWDKILSIPDGSSDDEDSAGAARGKAAPTPGSSSRPSAGSTGSSPGLLRPLNPKAMNDMGYCWNEKIDGKLPERMG